MGRGRSDQRRAKERCEYQTGSFRSHRWDRSGFIDKAQRAKSGFKSASFVPKKGRGGGEGERGEERVNLKSERLRRVVTRRSMGQVKEREGARGDDCDHPEFKCKGCCTQAKNHNVYISTRSVYNAFNTKVSHCFR
jgi:hypothetical protein